MLRTQAQLSISRNIRYIKHARKAILPLSREDCSIKFTQAKVHFRSLTSSESAKIALLSEPVSRGFLGIASPVIS